jgi:tartrate-resistant acid phosphatase type 5
MSKSEQCHHQEWFIMAVGMSELLVRFWRLHKPSWLVGIPMLGAILLTGLWWGCHERAEIRSHARALRETFSVATPAGPDVDLVLFGDWGDGTWASKEWEVARQITCYSEQRNVDFDAAVLLGDNFYKDLRGGVADDRWRKEFQELFLGRVFAIPFYAALGNHDYKKGKMTAELDYERHDPSKRWHMPAKWYAVDLPASNPFVSLIVLDSNTKRLSQKEEAAEDEWLESALAQRKERRWLIVAAHHPLFSNGHNGDMPQLIDRWGPLFQRHGVAFYACGHDHGLQHLEIADWPISFVVSGGGGAKLQPLCRDDRGPFSRSLHGFLHLHLTTNSALCRFVSVTGAVIHEFTRQGAGAVDILQSGGRDRPRPRSAGED